MDISDWSNREIVQVLVARNKISQKRLIQMLEEQSQEKIPQSTFANRLWRDSLRVRELQGICNALGYSIILQPKINSHSNI
ncbi:hypothetical protein IJ579_01550 [bacterium]|nr:hypothetical protein [bacterium]